MRIAALALVLAACGSSQPPPQPRTVENRAIDGGVALAEGCPAAWDRAVGGAACDATRAREVCAFDEGNCYCGIPSWCGGVAPPPDWQQQQTTWQCQARPPEVRADGCPGTPPQGACAHEGQQCSYGDCCVQTMQCIGGQWQVGQMSCPP